MILFLTDQQQADIQRALAEGGFVLADIEAYRQKFQDFGWSTPGHRMACAKADLHNALRSIAKTMQDASAVNDTMGEGA